MPTTPVHIVDDRNAVKYTGTNSADIDALITQFDITNESAGVLQFTSTSSNFTVNTNEWIIYTQGMVTFVVDQTEFDRVYICNAVCDDIPEIPAATAAIRTFGVAPVPTLILNQSATVNVTLDPAMPDTGYTAKARLLAGISITAVNITNVSISSASVVAVTVQNTGILSVAGVTVMVAAID